MDAKSFSTQKLIKPSGISLLILLLGILLLGAIALDWSNNSFKSPLFSLSLITCAIASGGLGAIAVPLLRRLKTGQIIQEDGPQTHLKKAGTPTMGGIFFVPVAAIAAMVGTSFSWDTMAVVIVTLAYGLIGWLDDWQVLHQKSNKGISPRMKLTLQIAVGILFSFWLLWQRSATVATINLPGGLNLALGWLFLPLAIFVLTAESNATNLTDGVDGLAAGTGAIALMGLSAIIAMDSPDLAIFCACLSGGCLGFLVHNRNPATVFMGDTGSLALGGALAAVGLLSNNLWGLFLMSGIFFVESLSVIAQVLYYKATKDANGQGKRLFKMAPIHHHFELSGWSETQVVGIFYLVNILLALVAYLSVS
ncbi:MAG: phospho-N-acetylmuramoyl-pentapeptide-transferase [Pleurocapsa sp.]